LANGFTQARAIADGLGKTIGQLREMGAAGELSTDQLVAALSKTAQEIDSEFQEMPVTVARATNRISNLMADAFGRANVDPLIEAIGDLEAAIDKPEVIAGLTSIAGAIVAIGVAAGETAGNLAGMATAVGEFFANALGGPAASDVVAMGDKLKALNKRLATLKELGEGNSIGANLLRKRIAALNVVYDLNLELIANSVRAKTKDIKATEGQTATVVASAREVEAATESAIRGYEKATEAISDQRLAIDALISDMEFELAVMGMTERERTIQIALRNSETAATEDQRAEIERLVGTIFDETAAMESARDETDALAKASEKAAEDTQKAWQKNRDVLSNFFFEFARDGMDAFDTLVEGFKAMIMKMLAEAAANKILLGVGLGGGLASAGASAGTSAAGSLLSTGGSALLSGGFSGMASSFSSGVGGLLSSAYTAGGEAMMAVGQATGNQAIFNAGLTKAGLGSTTAAQNAAGTFQVNYAGAAANIGAGIVGGYLGNELGTNLSGKKANSSIGAAAGGAIGAYAAAGTALGPWGAAIGAFVGALVDVFGGSANQIANKGARTELDLLTGARVSTGRQPGERKFSEANYNSVEAAADAFQQLSSIIGGSTANFNIHQGDRRGVRLNTERFDSMADAVAAGFDDIIAAATNLTPQLHDLVSGFNGTIDQTLQFSAAIISLTGISGVNSAAVAVEDYAAAQELAGITATKAYKDQTFVLGSLVANFDGSAFAADELNRALIANKNAAYEMSLAIQAIGDQIGIATETSSEYFRQAVLGPEELRQDRFNLRNADVEALRVATDPQQIATLVGNINSLNRLIFDSFSPEKQKELSGGFIQHTGAVDVIAQAKLNQAEEFLIKTQDDINSQVQAMLQTTASMFQKPVDDFGFYMEQFGGYVADLVAQGNQEVAV